MNRQTVRMEDGFIIVGDEAWLPEEWAAEQVRRERARADSQRFAARRAAREGRTFTPRRPPRTAFISPSLRAE